MSEKTNFSDKVVSVVMNKMAGPLAKLGENAVLNAVKDGLIGATPIVIIGSLFLLLATLGQPWIGNSGKALIPFLSPYSDNFLVAYNLTMNMLSLYACIGIAMSYADRYELDKLSSALLGLMSFILITTNVIKDGTISVAAFSASGLFAGIVAVIFSVWVYRICIQKNIVIKMPSGVPQGVGNAFSALIPFAVVAVATWGLRTVIGFDIVSALLNIMKPLFSATDNIFVYSFRMFLAGILWFAGLHGDNMLGPITQPLLLSNVAENAKALSEGVDVYHLPHIWTTALERMTQQCSSAWGLLILMWFSRVKYIRTLAIAITPALIFTITEPLTFGLPIVLNPFLLIPFVLSSTVAAIIGYGSMALHLVARPFIELPWATPPPIIGYLATGGDIKAVLVVIINTIVGVLIYYPFFKAFERNELEKEKLKAAEEIS